MEGLLKTYATRLARKHVLQKVGTAATGVLETEEQLLEMALSRLREGLLSMPDPVKKDVVAALIRKEAALLVRYYAEDEGVRNKAVSSVELLSDEEILPQVH